MEQIKIHILHTGLMEIDRSLANAYLSRNHWAYSGLFSNRKRKIVVPISSYLIEHPSGIVLIDTGWSKKIRQSQWKELKIRKFGINGYLPSGWAVDEQLNALGFLPSDIDCVLLSHLHPDHVGGLQLVAKAKKILVSRLEWDAANKFSCIYNKQNWQNIINIDKFEYKILKIGPYYQALDLFNDGSFLQVYTPGHTQGQFSTVVQGSDGRYVLLASDVAFSQKNWNKLQIPGLYQDKTAAISSLGWIQQAVNSSNCIEALANHDINVKPHSITLPY